MSKLSKYATDPIARAYWETAHRFLRQVTQNRDLRADDYAVVQLRGMLMAAYELGAKRSTEQLQAIDKAIAGHSAARLNGPQRVTYGEALVKAIQDRSSDVLPLSAWKWDEANPDVVARRGPYTIENRGNAWVGMLNDQVIFRAPYKRGDFIEHDDALRMFDEFLAIRF